MQSTPLVTLLLIFSLITGFSLNTNDNPILLGTPPEDLRHLSDTLIHALAEKDMQTIAAHAHEDGVRFSPYATVTDTNVVIPRQDIATLFQNERTYFWGYYDGTGDNMNLTFHDYYNQFIYDAPYAQAPVIAYNKRAGHGNAIHNLPEYYPDAVFIEYHFKGFDASLNGLDWTSLRLVFTPAGDTWQLIGIVHDEWTT